MPTKNDANVSFHFLGGWEFRQDGRTSRRLKTRKAESLLAFLACSPEQAHSRETISEQFWPGTAPENARQSLSQALSAIRSALKTNGNDSILLADHRELSLDATRFWCDVRAYQSLWEGEGETTVAAETAQRAIELYCGDLMPGHYDDWVLELRDRLQQRQLVSLETLVTAAVREGQHGTAIGHAQSILELDPLHEAGVRALLESLLATGRQKRAARVYSAFRSRLGDEIGVEPESETSRLVHHLQIDTPSSETTPRSTNQLPRASNRLIGRGAEVEHLLHVLSTPGHRLFTLTGLGGCGKTRLAVEAARQLAHELSKGAWFLPLSECRTSRHFLTALSDVFCPDGDDTQEIGAMTQHLIASLPAHSLIVLDNFEQLEAEAARILQHLVQGVAESTRFLATSRRSLNIEVELAIEVLPLRPEAASELFLDRLQMARADALSSSPDSLSLVPRIGARLEGIPLAIVLAAARCQYLTLEQLNRRLKRRLNILRSKRTDLPEKHRALRASLEASTRLLTPGLRKFFFELSAFAGTFSLTAVEEVFRNEDALDSLEELCSCSLLQDRNAGEEIRFSFLGIVREFAEEGLSETSRRRLQNRVLCHLADTVDRERQQIHGPERERILNWFRSELGNFRAALTLAEIDLFERRTTALENRVLKMCGQLGNYWRFVGLSLEGAEWNRRLLLASSAEGSIGSKPRAAAEWTRGYLLLVAGRDPHAEIALENALGHYRSTRDLRGQSDSLLMLGQIRDRREEFGAARRNYEEALGLYRRMKQDHGQASALSSLGEVLAKLGDSDAARHHLAAALRIQKEQNESWEVAACYNSLGLLELGLENFEVARNHFQKSLEYRRELGDSLGEGTCLYNLSRVAFRFGQPRVALGHTARSIPIHETLQNGLALIQDFVQVALSLHALGKAREAWLGTYWIRRHCESRDTQSNDALAGALNATLRLAFHAAELDLATRISKTGLRDLESEGETRSDAEVVEILTSWAKEHATDDAS